MLDTRIDKFRRLLDDQMREELATLDPRVVLGAVTKRLQEHRDEMIWNLLGLSEKWGKWEVDHCNGRNSPITQYLTAEVGDQVREFVRGIAQEVLTEPVKAKIRAAVEAELRKEYKYYYRRDYEQYVRERISTGLQAAAQECADRLISEIIDHEPDERN